MRKLLYWCCFLSGMMLMHCSALSSSGRVRIPDSLRILTCSLDTLSFRMMRVEGGTFVMGATDEQYDPDIMSDKPAHFVSLPAFYMAETEVTNDLWMAVMPECNPVEERVLDKQPVNYVSYADCQEFIRRLDSITGLPFRLPTEAEWEYAARGGQRSQSYRFAGANRAEEVGWLSGNSGNKKRTVARLRSNELGLYDMTGNLAEWVSDWYAPYRIGNGHNPVGPETGSMKVVRGGSYDNCAANSHISVRDYHMPDEQKGYIGFRLAITLPDDPANQSVVGTKELTKKVRIGGRRISFVYVEGEHPFYIAQEPITVGQWRNVTKETMEGRPNDVITGLTRSARERFVEQCCRATKQPMAAATAEELARAIVVNAIDTRAIPKKKLKRWQHSDAAIQRHRRNIAKAQIFADLVGVRLSMPDDPILRQYTDDPVDDSPLYLIIRLSNRCP